MKLSINFSLKTGVNGQIPVVEVFNAFIDQVRNKSFKRGPYNYQNDQLSFGN
jgi:hypothetical protein